MSLFLIHIHYVLRLLMQGFVKELLLSYCFSSTYIIHFTCNTMLLQACDCEDDGLLSFDVHSDGEGGRYVPFFFF